MSEISVDFVGITVLSLWTWLYQTERQDVQRRINELNQQLIETRRAIVAVENDVYHSFCQQIGVQHIRFVCFQQ